MKLSRCTFSLHKWDNAHKKVVEIGDVRTCLKCGLQMEFIEFLASGFSSGGDWFKKDKK